MSRLGADVTICMHKRFHSCTPRQWLHVLCTNKSSLDTPNKHKEVLFFYR